MTATTRDRNDNTTSHGTLLFVEALTGRRVDVPNVAAQRCRAPADSSLRAFRHWLADVSDVREVEWDEDKHPRLGGPPNPGWFATTGGSGAGAKDATYDRRTGTPQNNGNASLPSAWARQQAGRDAAPTVALQPGELLAQAPAAARRQANSIQAAKVKDLANRTLIGTSPGPANSTTLFIGHSDWTVTEAAKAGVTAQDPRARSIFVAALGCANVDTGLSAQQRLTNIGVNTPPTQAQSPAIVWRPASYPAGNLIFTRAASDQRATDASGKAVGYGFPIPRGVPNLTGATTMTPTQIWLSPNNPAPWAAWTATPSTGSAAQRASLITKYNVFMRVFTQDILNDALANSAKNGVPWDVFVHFGPKAAGVITQNQFMADVFGDTRLDKSVRVGTSQTAIISETNTGLKITVKAPAGATRVDKVPYLPWYGPPQ